MRLLSLLLCSFALGAASCAADGYYAPAEGRVDGFVAGGELARAETPAAVDDVAFDTTRWSAEGTAQHNATAGLFFADEEGGDMLARREHLFVDGDGDGLPDSLVAGGAGERGAAGQPPPRPERMLIYRGELRLEVARAEDAAKAFLAQVEAWGGYLQSQTGTRLSVRLPAERFDEAFSSARGSGRVMHEQRSASDVTEEFVDLGIRLDNARKSRERLIELLAKADKVEDMLKIENELRRLTEEIERMEGRAKFLRDQVAMATLDIEFRSVAEAPPPPPHRRQPSRFSWINQIGASSVMERF